MTQDEWLELNRQRPLDYWLRYVRDENPDARLALVCTHVPTGVSQPPWISRLVDRSLRKPTPSRYFVDSLEDDPEMNGEVEEIQDWLEQNLSGQVQENGLITPLFFERVADRVDEMLGENDMARRKGRTPVHLMLDWPNWCRQIEDIHAKLGIEFALQEEDIREITMHLYRTGTVFLLDQIEDKQVIIDQSWACGIMYEVLRPGGDLRARIKRNGGWFEEHDLSLSLVWDTLDGALRDRMLEVMEQCALIVRVDRWARGPEMPRTIFLANEKWLLPDYEEVLDRLDTAKVRIGSSLTSRKLEFKRASMDEFRAHRLMAELCQRFGRNTIWFRSGLQIIDDRAVPSWCLRLRWVADNERIGYSGTVDAQLFAREDVLEEVSDEFYSLFLQIGFDLQPRRDQESEVPHRLHEARNYFRLIQRETADVGISARGGDVERVEPFLKALRDGGVEDIKWYRDEEHQGEIRKAGVSHYMKNILGKAQVQVLFFSDCYLEDSDKNLHCPWELAKVINEWNANQLARERVITIWLPREEFGLGDIAVRIKQIFERLSRKFLDRYNESDSSRDLDDHQHFRNALRHVDEFLDARASWRGFFFTIDDLGGDPGNSAVVQEVVSLLEQ